MPTDGLHIFTDREEEIALFNLVLSRDPDKPWPLLPILAFIAPGGSGKSTLINYLRATKCRGTLPHAHIDFTVPGAPTDLLEILIRLRDELQRQQDDQNHHLSFPRFDFGALIASSSAEDTQEIEKKLSNAPQAIDLLGAVGNSLGMTSVVIGPLVTGLKLGLQLPVVRNTLASLEAHTAWTWYRQQGTVTGLRANADFKQVLLRMHELSLLGTPERDMLVSALLPAAFAADLYDQLVAKDPPQAWDKRTKVVVFLDGFEALERTSRETATLLLQALTTQQRQHGHTDPLLLVVGSRDPLLLDEQEGKASVPFERTDERTAQQQANELFKDWKQRAAAAEGSLGLSDLYLPLRLHDFGPEATSSYLVRFGERKHTRAFAESPQLVEAIDQLTHGYPLYLALAAEAVLAAEKGGRRLLPTDFELETVSPEIDPAHEREQIGDYLVNRLLRQLPDEQHDDLIFCAIPRFVDMKVLRELLPSTMTDRKVKERWNTYRQLSFMSLETPRNAQRSLLIHAVVRQLLLHQLPVGGDPGSDYSRIHTQLRNHFQKRASLGEDLAAVEVAYHALALGDPEPAIRLGIKVRPHFVGSQSMGFVYMGRPTLWDPLVEAVREAPTERLLRPTTRERANEALARAGQHGTEDAVTAIVLYTWLLSASLGTSEERADLQIRLGLAYSYLAGGDRKAYLRPGIEAATAHYVTPLIVALDPTEPAREANLRKAIDCYKAALQVYTREASPVDWGRKQRYLGNAHSDLPTGDREANLRTAIGYYEAALHLFSSMHLASHSFSWMQMDDHTRREATEHLERALERAKGELQKLSQPPQPGRELS